MACTTKLMQVCHTWEWSPTQIFPVVRKVCCRWPPAVDQTRNLLDFLVAMFLGGIQHAIMVTTFLRSDTLLLLVFVCQLFEGGVYKKKCIELSFTLLINLWYWQSANLYQQWLTGERPAVFSITVTALRYSAVLSAFSVPLHPFWPSLHSVLTLK